LIWPSKIVSVRVVNPISNARRLRREQTQEEKQLWRSLRAGRFAGFKFRRQHPAGHYVLDFYCPNARLAVELDGFGHGHPVQRDHDLKRDQWLDQEGIEVLGYWNHQWRRNQAGILLEIWRALHRRTGCVAVMRLAGNNRFSPPGEGQLGESYVQSSV
jgi:very-short-patch-repair endonuclease